MRKGILSTIFCVMAAVGLIACGGGGGGGTGTGSNTNSTPVANAGPDQNVATASTAILDGSGSSDTDGNVLTYSWSFTTKPAGSTATLSTSSAAKPTFMADKDGTYVCSLVVNDGVVNSANDTVTITATTTITTITTITTTNVAPVASAGPDQNVTKGSLVTLDGSGSSDANGDTLTYSWSFTSKPAGSTATLSNSTVVKPTFTADVGGSYVLSLIVNDGQANSAADSVTITSVNSAPVAKAGPDQNVTTWTVVTLNGSGSSDANGDALTYNWSFTSKPAGSTATLSSTSAVHPSFIADKQGLYVLSLAVSDGQVGSAADTVTVEAVNPVPLPDTGQTTTYTTTFGEDADYTINAPSYTDNGNGTITDNVTGLIWQKQDDATTRTWDNATTYCSNNTPGLSGTGWRLPTRMELISIVNYGTSHPAVNTTYFPNTKLTYYWSSSTYAGYSTNAWVVYFDNGFADYYIGDKTSPYYVRCVLGQPAASGFSDNGNGTVTDNVTGLMWQKQDDNTTKTWEDALSYCENLSLASHADWRLPGTKELSSLVDDSRNIPAIDPVFTGTKLDIYWSSSTLVYSTSYAWFVGFTSGVTINDLKTHSSYVRCVRGQ